MRLYFDYKLLESDTVFIFSNLIGMSLIQGFRRKKLGMTFMVKYSMYTKEFYWELARMYTEK